MQIKYFNSQWLVWGLKKTAALLVKKYFHFKKMRRQKLMTLLINQELDWIWENMLVYVIQIWYLWSLKNTQLLSFGSWNMRYPTSKFYYFGLLKNFTLIKAPFFLINRFCPSVFFPLLAFNWRQRKLNYSFQFKGSIQIVTMMLT